MQIEDDQLKLGVIHDIEMCMQMERIDQMMFYFLHIIEQLDREVIDETDVENLKKDIDKVLRNRFLMSIIELYYKVKEGEEGRLLFDPNVTDEPVYDLDKYVVQSDKTHQIDVFSYIIDLRRLISINLGKIKRLLKGDKGVTFEF